MLNHSPIDALLRAVADPTRRAILERLGNGPATVSALTALFDLTMAGIVQHLQVLEAQGLIRTEKTGRVRTCRIEPDGLAPLSAWISDRRTAAERQLDRLAALLAEPERTPSIRKEKKSD